MIDPWRKTSVSNAMNRLLNVPNMFYILLNKGKHFSLEKLGNGENYSFIHSYVKIPETETSNRYKHGPPSSKHGITRVVYKLHNR